MTAPIAGFDDAGLQHGRRYRRCFCGDTFSSRKALNGTDPNLGTQSMIAFFTQSDAEYYWGRFWTVRYTDVSRGSLFSLKGVAKGETSLSDRCNSCSEEEGGGYRIVVWKNGGGDTFGDEACTGCCQDEACSHV